MEKGIVTVTVEFEVSVQDLWNAITNPTGMKKWYFNIPHFSIAPGDTFEFYDSESGKYLHRCMVLETIPTELFRHTWEHPNESKGSSVVTWKLEARGHDRSRLHFTHEGLETFADAGEAFHPENYQMGWDAILKVNLRNYLYLTERLHFSININTTKDHVWEKLWSKESYTNWTQPFCEGSYMEGSISQGARVHFLMPNGSGMYSDVAFYQPGEFVLFQHIGNIIDFKEQAIDFETAQWTGCIESYRLIEITPETTELIVEVDVVVSHLEFMKAKFPLAMERLKEISEAQ